MKYQRERKGKREENREKNEDFSLQHIVNPSLETYIRKMNFKNPTSDHNFWGHVADQVDLYANKTREIKVC